MPRSIRSSDNANNEKSKVGKRSWDARVIIEVLTTDGSNALVEFRIRRETVEVWHHEHLAASFDRELLGEWLHDPDEDLICDEAMLSIDWAVDIFGRVALTLSDVKDWTLSPSDLDALYRRVREVSW